VGARIAELYANDRAPGVIVYNAVMGAPDQLMSSTPAHLMTAYAVDVVGAIVVAQSAAPAMRAVRFGTIVFTSVALLITRYRSWRPFLSVRQPCARRRPCWRPIYERTVSEWPP
jgi:NAD(P)-dependent dehydrogenase (short-subunit alcohol dehydrogenase family)